MGDNPRVDYNPGTLVLVTQTTPEAFKEWLIKRSGGRDSDGKHDFDRTDAATALAPLLEAQRDGDTLWICRSANIGPLFGNEGVCLVRDGLPIIYLRSIDH